MLTAFTTLRDHLLHRLARIEAPVGKMLVGTLMLYGALCAYGFTQL
jgi:hypothetical protein